MWDVKRKPRPVANAPPIPACAWPHADRDVFPAYVGHIREFSTGWYFQVVARDHNFLSVDEFYTL